MTATMGGSSMTQTSDRRDFIKLGGLAVAAAGGAMALGAQQAAAQAAPESLLRTVLARGKLIVGTGSTQPPLPFEEHKGPPTGMDHAMAPIPPQGPFDDVAQVQVV